VCGSLPHARSTHGAARRRAFVYTPGRTHCEFARAGPPGRSVRRTVLSIYYLNASNAPPRSLAAWQHALASARTRPGNWRTDQAGQCVQYWPDSPLDACQDACRSCLFNSSACFARRALELLARTCTYARSSAHRARSVDARLPRTGGAYHRLGARPHQNVKQLVVTCMAAPAQAPTFGTHAWHTGQSNSYGTAEPGGFARANRRGASPASLGKRPVSIVLFHQGRRPALGSTARTPDETHNTDLSVNQATRR
jgi:hypothetical protein